MLSMMRNAICRSPIAPGSRPRAVRVRGKGLFLAEILVAMALFISAFVTLLGVLTSGSVAIAQARDRVAGHTVAERILETVRSVYAPPNTLGPAANISYGGTQQVPYQTRGTNVMLNYNYTVTISSFSIGGVHAWKDIHVSVRWKVSDIDRSVELETAVGP